MFILHRQLLGHAWATSIPARALLPGFSSRSFSISSRKCSERIPSDRRPIVISGPSGSGKSTLIALLFQEFPQAFGFSVSHTTRKPRPGEKDGVAYHFVSKDTMGKLVDEDRFLEHAVFSGNHYGTSKAAVQDVVDSGKVCILDIDLQGVRRVRESQLPARYVFVRPKSLSTLEERLRGRGTETEEAIQKRLETARAEWEYGMDPANFDHVLVNDQLEQAYADLRHYAFSSPDKSTSSVP